MDEREKAIQLIRMKGPVVPSSISADLGKDILFTSVILAELASAKRLKISNLKVGSSPLYYLPEQAERLEAFYRFLPEKDRNTFALLKEKKVLRDSEQSPLVRVSLRKIKDFAVPLEVTVNGKTEVFWKWHTLSDEETNARIRSIISSGKPGAEEKKTVDEAPVNISNETAADEAEAKAAGPGQADAAQANNQQEAQRRITDVPAGASDRLSKSQQEQQEQQKRESSEKQGCDMSQPDGSGHKETRQAAVSEKPEPLQGKLPDDRFLKRVLSYFSNNGIEVLSFEIKRKEKEIDFKVRVSSKIGKLLYYCRAKDKKKVSDADIASAFVQSQMSKLPLIFVSTGEPTKKASEMLKREFESVSMITI